MSDKARILREAVERAIVNVEAAIALLTRCRCFLCNVERAWNKLFRRGAEPKRHKVEQPALPVHVPEDTVWH